MDYGKRPDIDELMQQAESQMFEMENPGFCTHCGDWCDECEPDVRDYPCEACDTPDSVYGAEELMIMTIA